MEHKAFIFDYNQFDRELRPALERALKADQCDELASFIRQNRSELTDPYEGEPLEADWEAMLERMDADEYADFCLTKYYDPRQDNGLGSEWIAVQSILEAHLPDAGRILLGTPVQVGSRYFDPGKMGSYFLSLEQVKEGMKLMEAVCNGGPEEHDELAPLQVLFAGAIRLKKGLYVTF